MSVVDDFKIIVEKGREAKLIPFLQGLDKAQKKELGPEIKKFYKYFTEYVNSKTLTTVLTSGSYSQRGTFTQLDILGVAAFVCLNQKDFESTSSWRIVNRKWMDAILPWYCPVWFNNYANNGANGGFYTSTHFDYEWYLELVDNGYLKINGQLIAKILPPYIFVPNKNNHKYTYHPEVLLKREITLKEHIWHLFAFDTILHYFGHYRQLENGSDGEVWANTFKTYAEKGLIDRNRLLKETLLATVKNFSNPLSNWFIDLFTKLEPTKTEIIALQPELFATFGMQHSKPYNVALKILKDITLEPGFALHAFLDNITLITTAESKTAVSSALIILDKLAKKHPDHREQFA